MDYFQKLSTKKGCNISRDPEFLIPGNGNFKISFFPGFPGTGIPGIRLYQAPTKAHLKRKAAAPTKEGLAEFMHVMPRVATFITNQLFLPKAVTKAPLTT